MKTIDKSSNQLKSSNIFHESLNENLNDYSNVNELASGDRIKTSTNDGHIRIPRSILSDAKKIFPGDFQKHAHRFTRSFSWKTKPEEPTFAHMQPLPKLIKRPGYTEICCKNLCWPTHQLCLCCGRNTAEGCRKWSTSTGEYDYNRACWSSCALCSDDAYKILNTPIVFKEKIIDPEFLLPLDAELLYYSLQSAKRQQEKQQNSSAKMKSSKRSKFTLPFINKNKGSKSLSSKRSRKTKKSSRSMSKKRKRKKSNRLKRRSRSKKPSRNRSKRRSKSRKRSRHRSKKHSKRKSRRRKPQT